ncbi:MAG: hypothetical protein U1E29_17785, partial [Coriobacteriia bacterium]|nr:hypothetical protein [Coriobacteriia bacterium]
TMTAAAADLPDLVAEEPFSPVGFRVKDRDRGLIGTVEEVIVTGANDVWIVEGGPFGQVLIPVIDDVVREIDAEAECIDVTLLDGLIEEEE